ncbi:MAG: hypothetical protein SAK42_18775, partial [Oscillatoria sp. PMC 1076.18]|nr:hypothetical protein [Oscillatoria sp. PMC 1076.18]
MNKLFTKNFKCACYFYLILLISAVRETFIRQKDSENDAIDRAWKNKNEEILRHTFLKRLKYLPLTFGFTALLVISVSQQPTNLLIAIIRMINLSSLVMIFGIAPMVFLWKIGKFPSFLHYLVSKEYLEASQGDMKES